MPFPSACSGGLPRPAPFAKHSGDSKSRHQLLLSRDRRAVCAANNLTVKYHRALSVNQTPMPLSVTQATAADLESIIAMMLHMQEDNPWSEPFHEPTVRANLAELLANPIYGVIYI